jgi:hypothetical protein
MAIVWVIFTVVQKELNPNGIWATGLFYPINIWSLPKTKPTYANNSIMFGL